MNTNEQSDRMGTEVLARTVAFVLFLRFYCKGKLEKGDLKK